MKVDIDLSHIEDVINPHFLPLLTDKNRYICSYGGAGSGKSYFIAQKFLIRIFVGMDTGIAHKVLCLRKTQPACRKSIYALFIGLLTDWGLLNESFVRVNQTDMSFTFKNGSQIICAGLDDPEKLKSIYGITSVWLEEASEITLDDFRQVNLRLRGRFKSYKQIIVSFNPISKMLWLYNEFFENIKDNATVHHSTYLNNKFLIESDPDYVKELESYKEIDDVYYNIYTLGQWGQLLESVYSNYEFIKEFPEDKYFHDIAYGLDVGFNAPSALIFIGERDEEFYLKEELYETKLTHNQLIKQMGSLIPLKHRRERLIYVDSAEPELIKQLNQSGFIAKKSDKSVKDGINYVKSNKLYINSESVNLSKEIGGYSYRKDNNSNILEEPIKISDHLMDAMRYGMYTHFGKIRPKASLVFV